MKIIILSSIMMLSSATAALCTDTLDCKCDKYLIRVHVGDKDYFDSVQLYEEGEKDNLIIPKDNFKAATLNWKSKKLNLNHLADSQYPHRFKVIVSGTDGLLFLDEKKFKISCDWKR